MKVRVGEYSLWGVLQARLTRSQMTSKTANEKGPSVSVDSERYYAFGEAGVADGKADSWRKKHIQTKSGSGRTIHECIESASNCTVAARWVKSVASRALDQTEHCRWTPEPDNYATLLVVSELVVDVFMTKVWWWIWSRTRDWEM